MHNAGVPLLQTARKTSDRSLYFFVGFVALLVVFNFQHKTDQEAPVGELAGCKTITGHYMEISTRKTQNNEIYVFQRGCQGRDVEYGAPFTVFGNTVSLGENQGTIQDDNSISWSNGDKWTLVPEIITNLPPSPAEMAEATDTTQEVCDQSLGGNCNCENISGLYQEMDPNNPDEPGEKIMYRQTGCTGADITHAAPFTIEKKHIKLMFGGDNEGDVQDDGSILWSNGFIHKPMASSAGVLNIAAGGKGQPSGGSGIGDLAGNPAAAATTKGLTGAVSGATEGAAQAAGALTSGVTGAVSGVNQQASQMANAGTMAAGAATAGAAQATDAATQQAAQVANAGTAAAQGVTNAVQGAQKQAQGAMQMAKMASMVG